MKDKIVMWKSFLNKRIALLAFFFMIILLVIVLHRGNILAIPERIISTINHLSFAVAIFLVTSIIIRVTNSRVFRFFEDEIEIEQRIFISKIYSFFIYVIAISILLWRFGLSLSNVALFLGLATTGIAFAVRDVLMSIFAWLIVLSKKPFRMHDVIRIENHIGEVVRIGTFFITIQLCKSGKDVARIPNRILLDKVIFNYGRDRQVMSIKIPLKEIPEQARQKIIDLRVILQKYTAEPQDLKVEISSDVQSLYLFIELPVHVYDNLVQTDIISEASMLFGQHIGKAK
jgi:MscS family membrane protein